MSLDKLLSEETKIALAIAQKIACENQHGNYSAAHILLGLVHKSAGLSNILSGLAKDEKYIREWAEIRMEELPKSGTLVTEPAGDDSILRILEEADLLRLKFSRELIDPDLLLLALCKPNLAFSTDQLKSFNISQKELIDFMLQEAGLLDSIPVNHKKAPELGKKAHR